MLVGPLPFGMRQALADPPPCANLAAVPDDLPVEGELCLDAWINANTIVHQLLFGPGSSFSIDAPGYRVFGPIGLPGFYGASTPLGTPFILNVMAFVSAGLNEPGALDGLPPNLVATAISQQVSAGFIFGEMMRKDASVPVEALYIGRLGSNGQPVYSFHVFRIMPLDLAESFRTSSEFLQAVPPL
jgi:hypothetical protein